jgi:hypothetical protein
LLTLTYQTHSRLFIGTTHTLNAVFYNNLANTFSCNKTNIVQWLFLTAGYNKVCQWLVAGRWFSPVTLISSTNKANRYDITEILLKVALSTVNQTLTAGSGVDSDGGTPSKWPLKVNQLLIFKLDNQIFFITIYMV